MATAPDYRKLQNLGLAARLCANGYKVFMWADGSLSQLALGKTGAGKPPYKALHNTLVHDVHITTVNIGIELFSWGNRSDILTTIPTEDFLPRYWGFVAAHPV